MQSARTRGIRPARRSRWRDRRPARAVERERGCALRAPGWRRRAVADRHRFDLLFLQRSDRARDLLFRQRRDFAAVGGDAACNLEPAVARRRRHRLRDIEVEIIRSALPRQFENIAKALRRDQPGACPPALQHGVGRQRRAQHQQLDNAAIETVAVEQFDDAVEDAFGRIGSERRHLVVMVPAALQLNRHEIGKGAARVDADANRFHPGPGAMREAAIPARATQLVNSCCRGAERLTESRLCR
jgi:hypothetical protein